LAHKQKFGHIYRAFLEHYREIYRSIVREPYWSVHRGVSFEIQIWVYRENHLGNSDVGVNKEA